MENPVILIESVKRRDLTMHKVMSEGLELYDACGSRAVIWSEKKNTQEMLEAIVKKLGKIEHAKLSVIEDPGLGIILPGDFE
jgi:hypothetical protein